MKGKQEFEVPIKVYQQVSLTLDNLIKCRHQGDIFLAKLVELSLDVGAEVADSRDVVVDFIVLTGQQQRGDLM